MRRTLLAALAAFGALAAGCTARATGADPSRAPTSADEAAAINDPWPTPNPANKGTLADMFVGETATLKLRPSPFEAASSGCVLRGDAAIGVINGKLPSHLTTDTFVVDHPAESVWQIFHPKMSGRWTFTEGSNMQGLLFSDADCPALH